MSEPQIKDARGWSAVDYGYLDNPKMLDVLDESSIAALMHLASILYCAQHLTDGHITPGIARRKVGGSKDDDRLLIGAGLWHEEGHDCPDCPQPEPSKVYVHDFLQHNRTAAKAKRRSEAARRNAEARWKAKEDANRNATGNATGMPTALQMAMPTDEIGNAEREKEREKDTPPSRKRSEGDPEGFDAWWAQWPKKVARAAAVKAYKSALKKTDALTLGQKAAAFIEAEKRKGTAIEYIPNASTWLNQERWEDDTSTPATMAPKPEWMKYV